MPRRFPALIFAITIAALLASAAGSALAVPSIVFSDSFDDGDWTAGTYWRPSPASPSVTVSSEQFTSSPYSLKIDADNCSGAVRAPSGLRAFDQPFTCTFNLFVEAIPEEGIPWCLMDASGGVVALIFLLPGGRVELTTWKAEGGYVKSAVAAPLPYGQWHAFKVTYDGSTQALHLDGAATPSASVTLPFRAAPCRISIGNFQIAHTGTYYVDDIFISAEAPPNTGPPGRVYVQFCSDTSTGGLATSQNPIRFPSADETYTSPTGQAARVMAEPWRTALRDSMGNPVKLTWYMNCGSIYSCGVDTTPILPYELLEDNHGEAIARWGDEMAYHYHTWAWTDPDSDGVFQWNQTETFLECLADFDATIAQFVLDRRFYPCSFRSGWNWMENPWEAYLDDLFPYRFEGRWFGQGWTPYHPAAEDWRVPGGMRGWEAFHTYIPSFDEMDADDAFMMARTGMDQAVTLWSHLKESDFPEQVAAACALFEAAHQRYPDVEFEYLTARECMLKWRKGSDVAPPVIGVSTSDSGDVRTAVFCTDEDIYQASPFVARKGADGEYSRIPCAPAGPNRWSVSYNPAGTLQIAVAVTDWFGNAAVQALPVPLRMGPVRVSATPTAAEVQWTANLPVSTRIELALMPSGDTAVLVDTTPHSPHKATFTGLLPGRVYRIRVASETAGGERAQAPDSYVLTPLSGGTIVDNPDSGFAVTGTWSTGSSAAGRYGADYRYATTSPSGVSHADWTLTAPETGLYRVCAWWPQGSNRSEAAPYTVFWRGQESRVPVNQQTGGGMWNPLGTFALDEGESVAVRLGNTAPSGFVVIADAVMIEPSYPAVAGPGLARLLPAGEGISLSGLIVTAVFADCFYAQAADRSAGVRIEGSGAAEGDTVTVSGDLADGAGERVLLNALVQKESGTSHPAPLSAANAACSTGQSPAGMGGLLMRAYGRVVRVEPGFFTLDDGSGAPVRVDSSLLSSAPDAGAPADGAFAIVTGVVGAAMGDGVFEPLIRPRRPGDLTIVLD